MPAEPIAQLSAEDYLRRQAEFPTTTHTITVTPGEAADFSDATFNIYKTTDIAAARTKTKTEIKEDLAKRLAQPDNTFGRKLPKVESRGAKKCAEYALVAVGIVGNLFIIYTLDIEATAFLMNNNEPMAAHTAFHEKPWAFAIGSVIGFIGTIPIALFQAGFGADVTSLPPAVVALTALPGASSAMLHFYNALATLKRLFGPDFYKSDLAIPFKGIFGVTGLFSAWAGNVGFFVKDLIAENGLIRQQISFQMDSVARTLKSLTCRNAFAEPKTLVTRSYVAMDGDGRAPSLSTTDVTLGIDRVDYLIRQINLLMLLAEVYIPDAALADFFRRVEKLIPAEEKDSKLSFEQLQAILHELGKLFKDHDDCMGEVLSFIGNLPTQVGSFILAYYGAIAFMPNANEFLDTIFETCGLDPFADNVSEGAGFYVFLGWMINLGMQGLTLPSNLFRPLLRAAFAQDHLAKRSFTSLIVLILAAAVAYNMFGLITQTDDVDNGWDTLIPAAAANLNITSAIYGLILKKLGKADLLGSFKQFMIRINRSFQAMRTELKSGQLEMDELSVLIEEVKACLDEFKGRATATATHPATDGSGRTRAATEEAKESRGSSTPHHADTAVMTMEPATEGVHRRGRDRVASSAPEAVADLATRRAGLRDERYGRRWSEGHWYSPVANFFRRICYDTYQPAELDDSLVPAAKHGRR